MLMYNRMLVLSNAIKRRLIHRPTTFNLLNENKSNDIKNTTIFDPEKLILSSTSIKPFLNSEKINLLKNFYETQNEIKCTYNFVVDEEAAKDIAKNIVGHDEEKKIIVEGNPGLGLITLNLIDSAVSHILVFDHSELWDVSLAQICTKHQGRVMRKTINMNKTVDAILSSSLDLAEQRGLPVAILGVTTSFYFIRGLIINVTKYEMWKSQFQVFLVVSRFVWTNLKEINRKKYFKFHGHCLFNLLFKAEEIARYPRAAFLPYSKHNTDDMILIRISINPDAFTSIKENELHDYFRFLRIIGTKKSNYVIPVLEKWLPGCGPYLISKGVSMTTQISDLSHDEAVYLFNFLKNCEGFEEFKACTSHIFSKVANTS